MRKVSAMTATPAETTPVTPAEETPREPSPQGDAWNGFRGGLWRDTVDVRDFVQHNYAPYEGDASFLAGPTERTGKVWNQLLGMFPTEIERGIYDVDTKTPSRIDAFAPGYIDRDLDLIVGLQTDAPLKRAIMPNGGWRMVEDALTTYGYEPDPVVKKIFTSYRKTHNQGVFDVYPPDVRAARRSHIITGLPDAYGRGRIIGDYRRVALYGTDRLIEAKRADKALLDGRPSTEHVIRDREELAEQIRALGELKQMAAAYGFDISGPATTGARWSPRRASGSCRRSTTWAPRRSPT
jgi:formate C-acetyltransferase